MKLPALGLVPLLVVWLTGCTLFPKKQAPVTPPAPVAVAPPPPEQPLSIPQTTAQLPSPQPVQPEAIPPLPPPPAPAPEKTESAPAQKTRRSTAKPENAAETEQPSATQAAPTEGGQSGDNAPFQPILSAQEQSRLKSSIEARHREIEDRLRNVKHPSGHDQSLIDRINSFVTLSGQAAQRGDFTQADALLERAIILSKELPVE